MATDSPREHFLFPSTLFASREPHRVQTILGSCIAVCLYDHQLNFGGINHYMLPWWDGKEMASPRFGNIAIQKLVEKMIAMGSHTRNLTAKIFGAANQHSLLTTVHVSNRNIEVARKLLQEYRIPITAENVGGDRGRKIVLQTNTHQVWMKYLERTENLTTIL